MTATKREKMIALGAGVGLLLAALGYAYVVSPYFDRRAELQARIKVARDQYTHEAKLLSNQPKVSAEWKAMLGGTLRTTRGDAVSKTQDALFDAARSAGFDLQLATSDRPVQAGDFQQIHLKASGAGSGLAVSRWLWAIESSNLPVQIDEFRLTARKEGTDEMTLQVGLTALVFAPPPPTKAGSKARPAATGDTE